MATENPTPENLAPKTSPRSSEASAGDAGKQAARTADTLARQEKLAMAEMTDSIKEGLAEQYPAINAEGLLAQLEANPMNKTQLMSFVEDAIYNYPDLTPEAQGIMNGYIQNGKAVDLVRIMENNVKNYNLMTTNPGVNFDMKTSIEAYMSGLCQIAISTAQSNLTPDGHYKQIDVYGLDGGKRDFFSFVA